MNAIICNKEYRELELDEMFDILINQEEPLINLNKEYKIVDGESGKRILEVLELVDLENGESDINKLEYDFPYKNVKEFVDDGFSDSGWFKGFIMILKNN